MSLVKLTVLRNQIGDIHVAKVLKDGNLLVISRDKEQRERACLDERNRAIQSDKC